MVSNAWRSFLLQAVVATCAESASSFYNPYNTNLLRGFAVHPVYDDTGSGYIECGTRTVAFEPRRTGKIVGGSESPYGAYPWQVGLYFEKV